VKNNLGLLITVIVVTIAFVILWRKGSFLRVSNYVSETQDELKKCTWPSIEELKGSTVVVMITIALMGGFTMGVDFVLSMVMRLVTT
jgi:preprotein translocase subunit SecE